MRKQLNPALIGAFVLLGLGLLIGGLLYLGIGLPDSDKHENVSYFRTQTNGLNVGAPVVLQGVKIGSVTAISVGFDETARSFYVVVRYQTNGDEVIMPEVLRQRSRDDRSGVLQQMVAQGLRARLAMQSVVTGRLMLELGFFPGSEYYARGVENEIPTIPTTVEKFLDELSRLDVKQLASSIQGIVVGLDKLVSQLDLTRLEGEAYKTLVDLDLAINEFRSGIKPVGDKLQRSLDQLQQLLLQSGRRLDTVADSIERAGNESADLARNLNRQSGPLARELRATAQSITRTFQRADRVLQEVGGLVADNSPLHTELLRTLTSITEASRALRDFANYLERHPEALLRGKNP